MGNVEAEDFLQTTPPDPELLSSEAINGAAVKKSGTNLCSKSVCVLVAFLNDILKLLCSLFLLVV